ncbi:MAG TPA: type II secretion system protein [Candidatus Paceibacterota bacterium]
MPMTLIANKNNESGLTMIELIVAMGIFGLVVSMTAGIFVLSIISQRRIIALRNTEDNIRFAIEAMAREMKTGQNFSGGGSSIAFTNARGEAAVYRLNGNVIEKSSDGGASYSAVSGAEIVVNYLNFYLMGQAIGDGLEPRVTVAIGVTSSVGNQTANLKIQTTISERLLQN